MSSSQDPPGSTIVTGWKQGPSNSHTTQTRQAGSTKHGAELPTASTSYLTPDTSPKHTRKKLSNSIASPATQDARPLMLNPHVYRAQEPKPSPHSAQSTSQFLTPRAFPSIAEPSYNDASISRTKRDSVKSGSSFERPQSRHSHHSHSSRSVTYSDPQEKDKDSSRTVVEKHTFSGPIAIAEFDRMRKEIEALKKLVHETKKASKKQAKKIDELRVELSASAQTAHERELEVGKMKGQCRKHEDLISTIEASIQCQICMDLPLKPFALAPCGHVLCLSCLQEWFKTTPGLDEDDDESRDPNNIMTRQKTCPCCRSVVRHRPAPVFMIKAVASALLKEKEPLSSQGLLGVGTTPADDDPWKDIFPSSDEDNDDEEESDDDEEESDDDEEESDDDEDDENAEADEWMFMLNNPRRAAFFDDTAEGPASDSSESEHDHQSAAGDYDDDSTDEEYDSANYVLPRWEPPTVYVNPYNYDLEHENRESVLGLLRRGCSWEMIQNFNMRYSHRRGIVVSLRSIDHLYASDDDADDPGMGREGMHQVFLGWNIKLDEDDIDGEAYMHQVLCELKDYPERWRLIPRYDGQGSLEVRRLVRDEAGEEYSTTDTEVWLESDTNDMDVD